MLLPLLTRPYSRKRGFGQHALAAGLLIAAAPAAAQPPSQPAPSRLAGECAAAETKSQPDPRDIHNLATCFYLGDGRVRNYPRARELYRQAGDRGFAKAQCALGNMMIQGQGGPRDSAGGVALCRRAAEAGEPDAQTDLGGYLLLGTIVPKDAVEARHWLTLAARQRQANAAHLLGQIYWNGDGVARDRAEAARWWRVAHEAGRPDSALLLGNEALKRVEAQLGRPEGADPAVVEEALRWFDLAAQADPLEARRRVATESAAALRAYLALHQRRQPQ